MERAQIEQLADAASIHLDAVELDRLTMQLREILQQLEVLTPLAQQGATDAAGGGGDAGAGTADVAVDGFPHGVLLRDDVPSPDPLAGTLSRFAPETKHGFFTVPPVPGADR